jgi:hypothetical protein
LPRPHSKLDDLSDDERKALTRQLWESQKHMCYLRPSEPIDLDTDSTNIDHVIPLDERPDLDVESNFALMHETCNKKKRARNLELARILARFEDLSKKYSGHVTSHEILEEVAGSKKLIGCSLNGTKMKISYESNGGVMHEELPLYPDPSDPQTVSFFANIPKEYIFHDKDLNPRSIIDIDKLVTEFWRKNPQLQVALARLHTEDDSRVPTEERNKILLFDGQHKTASQLLLGHDTVTMRIFANPDKDHLKATNARAHRELRQIEFFKSVFDQLGDDLFAQHFKAYLQSNGGGQKSESGFISSVEAEKRREELGYLRNHLYNRIARHKDNRFMQYVEMEAPRSKTWPVSYDVLGKTLWKDFVYNSPSDKEVQSNEEEETRYVRFIETENVVRLMNIFADKILVNKFDKEKGIYKLDDRMKKGLVITDDHLLAYRVFRPAAFQVWCGFLRKAAAMILLSRGRIKNIHDKNNQIFWNELQEDDWKAMEKMVTALTEHKIWKDRTPMASEVFGQNKIDFFQTLFETGAYGNNKSAYAPLTVQYLFDAALR